MSQHDLKCSVPDTLTSTIFEGRRVEGRKPDGVHAKLGEIGDLGGNPLEIANAVAVCVVEGARVDLVDAGLTPPIPRGLRHEH